MSPKNQKKKEEEEATPRKAKEKKISTKKTLKIGIKKKNANVLNKAHVEVHILVNKQINPPPPKKISPHLGRELFGGSKEKTPTKNAKNENFLTISNLEIHQNSIQRSLDLFPTKFKNI